MAKENLVGIGDFTQFNRVKSPGFLIGFMG